MAIYNTSQSEGEATAGAVQALEPWETVDGMTSTGVGQARKSAEIARPKLMVVLTGPDPEQPIGGMSVAMAGYRRALAKRGLLGAMVPTFQPNSFTGKWWPWLRAIPTVYGIIRKARKKGRSVVVYGHAGPRASIIRESLVLAWARILGAQTMLQLHSPWIDRELNEATERLMLKMTFMPVSTVTVLSPWWQRRLSAAGLEGAVVIPNPLSPELEAIARRKQKETSTNRSARSPVNSLTIVSMTRLFGGKCVHVAIQALQYLPQYMSLCVAGDGPQRDNLENLARSIGVANRVRFAGWVSGTEKARILDEADIFCLPSRADSFGMVFVEAMGHGKPVVTVNSRAIADVVVHGKTGLIVDPDDPEAIAQAIRELEDPSIRSRMGAAGLEWVLTNFGADVVGRRIAEAAYRLVPAPSAHSQPWP